MSGYQRKKYHCHSLIQSTCHFRFLGINSQCFIDRETLPNLSATSTVITWSPSARHIPAELLRYRLRLLQVHNAAIKSHDNFRTRFGRDDKGRLSTLVSQSPFSDESLLSARATAPQEVLCRFQDFLPDAGCYCYISHYNLINILSIRQDIL